MKLPAPFQTPPERADLARYYSNDLYYALLHFTHVVYDLSLRDDGVFDLLELWYKERRAQNYREEIETIRELMRSVLDYALTVETKP